MERANDTPIYNNDHDLLIDMRRILLTLRDDLKENMRHTDDLDKRITVIERHMDITLAGRFVTTEGEAAERWNRAASNWDWFNRIGKWIWIGVGVVVNGGLILVATWIARNVK